MLLLRCKPEFLNRIDETIVFRALNKEDMKQIITIMAAKLQKRCKEQLQIDLSIRDAAKKLIVEKAYDRKYGARPLRRKLQEEVEDRLSEKLISGEIAGEIPVAVMIGDSLVQSLNALIYKFDGGSDACRTCFGCLDCFVVLCHAIPP